MNTLPAPSPDTPALAWGSDHSLSARAPTRTERLQAQTIQLTQGDVSVTVSCDARVARKKPGAGKQSRNVGLLASILIPFTTLTTAPYSKIPRRFFLTPRTVSLGDEKEIEIKEYRTHLPLSSDQNLVIPVVQSPC
jgi:hypothetical protein